ncbi:MAG TPA: RNA methyltransferase [Luteibaculaceae bacterium]|nr:RNA methyltransferase [Luteibaculaceae bacterium]
MDETSYRSALTHYLLQFLNDRRKELLFNDISIRTRHLCLVLEDFYHPHNISAAIRTSDCFGLMDIHIVENSIHYERNPGINKGSDKWMRVVRYTKESFNTPACLTALREKGYQIVATSPHEGSVDLRSLDIRQKTAIVMGAESYGISDYVKENADAFIRIDTPGFTESLNVSVAAGIILENLNYRMRNEPDINWQLTNDDRDQLLIQNLAKMVDDVDLLEVQFRERNQITSPDRVFERKPARRSTEIH